jgi:hypothetical protein
MNPTKAVRSITTFTAIATAAGLLATPGARAQHPGSGPELGVRAGLAVPFGQVRGGDDQELNSFVSTAIPLGLEAGYRFDSNLVLGVRFHYAFPQLKNPVGNCDNTDCNGSGTLVGLQGLYRFAPDTRFGPWAGLGIGYEWWAADYVGTIAGVAAGGGATVRGFQGSLQAGGDIHVARQFTLGPYLEFATGRFDSATTRVRAGNTTNSTPEDIADTAWHSWLTLGVRGGFGL